VEITEKLYVFTRCDKYNSLERRYLFELISEAGTNAGWAWKPQHCSLFPTSDWLWWKDFFL